MSAKKPTPKKSPGAVAKKDPTPTKKAATAAKKDPTPTKKAAAVAAPKKATPTKKAAAKKEEPKEPEVVMEEDSEQEEEVEEEQKPAPTKGQKRKSAPQPTLAEDDEDSEEEEAAPVTKKTKTSESTSAATRWTTSTDPKGNSGTIVVKGLAWTATTDDVRKFIEASGAAIDSEVPIEIPKTPKFDGARSRGFAFVSISSGLQKVLALNGSKLHDRTLQIEPRTNQQRTGDEKVIFIENFPEDTTNESLSESFTTKFGPVKFAKVKQSKNEDGSVKMFAHVGFVDAASCGKAVDAGTVTMGGKTVKIGLANNKGMTEKKRYNIRGRGRGRGGRGRGSGGRGRGQ